MDSSTTIPAYLSTPPLTAVAPPVRTRAQKLPFGELAWEDFERLCLRLVRTEAEVLHCQLYGTPGQNQEGIDFYAKLAGGNDYCVYQCKRENNFSAAKIKKAVNKFLTGVWAKKARTLVLCTKESLIPTKRANEIEAQRQRLANEGITLFSWDSLQLSSRLKKHPELVDDFFGRAWVTAFCGEEVANGLGCRLDALDVIKFRKSLGVFYARVFAKHDPGLPLASLGHEGTLALRDRYVVPDILEFRSFTDTKPDKGKNALESDVLEPGDDPGPSRDIRPTIERTVETSRERTGVEAWLARSANLVVLGGPGSGKSSLLRFLAIDLLEDAPSLQALAERWGNYLPVWVPFPLWTQLIASEGKEVCSLTGLLRLWLKSWDEDRLFPIVEKALADERLLLLIDGLDEWLNEGAARVGLQRLQVFIEQRHVPAVATSRPQGLSRMGIRLAGWTVGELAGLTSAQQRQLAMAWFRFREASVDDKPSDRVVAHRRADISAESFFAELAKSFDLSYIAQNPLLLVLLIYHRFHHARLPQTRFQAYESLVEHLISVHPQHRRAAASTTVAGSDLSEGDIKQVLAYVAFHLLSSASPGVLPADEATRQVQQLLQDTEHGFGLELAEARRLARWVTEVGEANLGLLVRQSPTDLGFLHRAFEEFLAALHLSRMPLVEQERVLRTRCTDPQWREVVLALLYCNMRPADVDRLVTALREERDIARPADRLALESLLCEAAFGDFHCSARVARELATEAFDVIETGLRMSHRERLLGYALGGFSSTRVRDLVKDKVERWFPCWFFSRALEYEAMGDWPPEPETIKTIWVGLFEEETQDKIGAAAGLAAIGKDNEALGKKVARLARSSEDPLTRAAALYALARGWPGFNENTGAIEVARKSDSPRLLFAAIWAKGTLGIFEEEDLPLLLSLASPRSELDYTLRRQLAKLLIAGWRGNPQLKAQCLRALRTAPSPELMLEHDLAWQVLLVGFPQDDEVAEQVVLSLDQKLVFSTVLENTQGWGLLAANFGGHPKLIAALDRWIDAQEHSEDHVAHAALVGRTSVARQKLIGMLGPGRFAYWPALALAKGWGMGDKDVAKVFSDILSSAPSNACRFAHVFPIIIADRTECRALLLRLLKDPDCKRPDLVLAALAQISPAGTDTEVVDAVLGNCLDRPGVFWMDQNQLVYSLVQGFHRDPRVRQVAKDSFVSEYPPYSAIARVYADDTELRAMLRKRMSPLPDRLRLVIARRLAEECPDQPFALSLLSLYGREQNEAVKCQASLSYWRLVKERGELTKEMRERLARDIVRYGPDYQEQRQAAFCGLATLGQFDVMARAKERGDERICAISLFAHSFHPNVPLLRCILEHWSEIRATFGEQICVRLNDRRNDWCAFWDGLSPHADSYPLLVQEILTYLESRTERTAPGNLLRFLARVRPKSQLLLEYCLGTLHVGEDGFDVGPPIGEIASSILGDNFRGDSSVLERVLAGRASQDLYQRTVLALSEGWPDHPYLLAAYHAVTQSGLDRFAPIYHQLVCHHGTLEEVQTELQRVCAARPLELRQRGISVRPFMQRLRRDGELAASLLALLRKNPTNSEKSSLPKLIALARGANEELRAWCDEELVRQTGELPCPEIGIDILLKEERCVTQSLIAVLTTSEGEILIDE